MGSFGNKHIVAIAGILATSFAPALASAGDNTYSLGVEGFYDQYHEPGGDLETQAGYGAITGNYTHDWKAFFAALDARASYGLEDYQSISGTSDGTPAWEFEGRVRGGYSFNLRGGDSISPYLGVGTRYYWDEGKGVVTSLGAEGYDRKITQVYMPVGFTYLHAFGNGFTLAPNLEYDQLLWGHVSSRLGTIPGYPNVVNIQHDGWGARGDIMLGWQQYGLNWQIGPFLRYWDISASNIAKGEWEEPDNTRLQVGLALRALW
jgi:hypothetical protein